MRLDKEFKEETNKAYKEFDYAFFKGFARAMLIIFIVGLLGVGCTYTIGRWQKNAQREVFKESVAYNESAAEFIAKSYSEYNRTEDKDERKAICDYVRNRYPNLDSSKIDNRELRIFYEDCVKGIY